LCRKGFALMISVEILARSLSSTAIDGL